MSTRRKFEEESLNSENEYLSSLKVMIETAFYGNNVHKVKSVKKAYELALKQPQTIVLDQEVTRAQDLGLPKGAKVLVDNGSSIVGRTARARRIYGKDPEVDSKLLKIVMDAIYKASTRPFLEGEAIIGLDEEFMVRAHLMVPETQVNNLYSWLVNFQIFDEEYKKRYENSIEYDENDIFILADPSWAHPDFPDGLTYFDTQRNVAIILGLQYFGELKKGTLTLAWATAARQGFAVAHGGLKRIIKDKDNSHVAAFYGLSGSGKSTLTHAKHDDKYDITVLHDDAFIINQKNGHAIALEPSYFDQTKDYPTGHPEQNYFIIAQNVGVTLDKDGERVLITEGVRNGNGRTVKSRYSTPNRVDKVNVPIDAIYWIMKDETLPPIIRVKDPILASAMGCSLISKRSIAENVKNLGQVVIEPYANPFRVYPLVDDYNAYKDLFEQGVDCYIINTGSFMDKDIPPHVTLASIENNIEKKTTFKSFDNIDELEYLPIQGYEVPFNDVNYREQLRESMEIRINALRNISLQTKASDQLPKEVAASIQKIADKI